MKTQTATTGAREDAAPREPAGGPAAASPPPVPPGVWAAAAAVAALRAVPFLVIALPAPPPGYVTIPAAFVPEDWLAYVALVRQGPGPFANPFTTEPQGERLVLLLHQALGAIHAATGLDPFWLLELSRVPLLFAFTWALWRLAAAVYAEPRDRTWACLLVLLSGGLGFVARCAMPWLPETVATAVRQDLWTLYGWSTFEAAFNPAWIAGLTLALLALRPVLQPGGPVTRRDAIAAAGAFAATWAVHPYSAIAAGAATAGALASRWISGEPGALAHARRVAVALAPAAVAVGALTAWQRGDEAFRAASGGALGEQGTPVAWYPIAFAAVGFFALRGLRALADERHPWRHALGGWAGAIALLHSSNVLNGYHYVFALHVPVALLAARPVAAWFAAHRGRGWPAVAAIAVAALLFASPVATTATDTKEAPFLEPDVAALLATLAASPPGHVLAPPQLGNVIPAWTHHRVFVGHWFMTPNYEGRAAAYDALLEDPGRAAELAALCRTHRIDYVLLPVGRAGMVAAAGLPVARWEQGGGLALAILAPR